MVKFKKCRRWKWPEVFEREMILKLLSKTIERSVCTSVSTFLYWFLFYLVAIFKLFICKKLLAAHKFCSVLFCVKY